MSVGQQRKAVIYLVQLDTDMEKRAKAVCHFWDN